MSHGRGFRQIVSLRNSLCKAPELPFSELLTEGRILGLLAELNVTFRERLWTPCVTLWTFLWQVLSPDHSCRDAAARLLAFRLGRGLSACSTRTGRYCEARKNLPEELPARLMRETGAELSRNADEDPTLGGRRVKVVDGTTVSMPDTAENTAGFGKPTNQTDTVMFPVARLLAVLCLASVAALELAVGPYCGKKTGELSLFKSLPEGTFQAGDILLGDELFCSWILMAQLRRRCVDVVFRKHHQRKTDFRTGRRLGKEDHIVVWKKPPKCPDTISQAEFDALPETLAVREVRVRVVIPGFRVKVFVVVTTLLDAKAFPREAIAALYRQRWQAEIDLRSIKTTLQMDVLRCKTPAMVRKEIGMHLLAYNLLRSMMAAAARQHGLKVRDLSFKATLQHLEAFRHQLLTTPPEQLEAIVAALLAALAPHRVGNRPDRVEPRKRKRDQKPYPRLKRSRAEERKACLKQN